MRYNTFYHLTLKITEKMTINKIHFIKFESNTTTQVEGVNGSWKMGKGMTEIAGNVSAGNR